MDSPNKTGKEALKELFKELGIEGELIELDNNDPDMLSKLKDKILGHRCNLDNPAPKFPSLSVAEGDMYIKLISTLANRAIEVKEEDDLLKWDRYIFHILTHCNDFKLFIQSTKEIIHRVNRTAAIECAYTHGLLIGLFLGRPDLVPTLDSDKIDEKEDVSYGE